MERLPNDYTLAINISKADIKEVMGLSGIYFLFTLLFSYILFRPLSLYKYSWTAFYSRFKAIIFVITVVP